LGKGRLRVLTSGTPVAVPGDLAIAKSQLALKLFGPTARNIAHVKETDIAGAQIEDNPIVPGADI
jgi:hypothetical protein